jgi:hypothetical protein
MRIATWNVLASEYCKPERYPSSPCGWDNQVNRVGLVVDVIKKLYICTEAVCLQEVDDYIYDEILKSFPNASIATTLHPHRYDRVMVISSHLAVGNASFNAGDMGAAALRFDLEGISALIVSAHLGWSQQGELAAKQLETLFKGLERETYDLCLIGLDSNSSFPSPVHDLLKSNGWFFTQGPPTAYIEAKGWIDLDMVLAKPAEIALQEVWGGGDVIPSLAWPSDHCAVICGLGKS